MCCLVGPVACRPGEQANVNRALVECPPAGEVALRSDPEDIISVIAIPPSCKYMLNIWCISCNTVTITAVCHISCVSCATIGESTQCLSCHSGFELYSSPPSACNVTTDFGSGSGTGPIGKPPPGRGLVNMFSMFNVNNPLQLLYQMMLADLDWDFCRLGAQH